MKLFFSLLITMSLNGLAATPLVLITYDGDDKNFLGSIKKVMTEQFKMGEELYQIRYETCRERKSLATHICINQNKEITTVYRNKEVMEEMLGIYWK